MIRRSLVDVARIVGLIALATVLVMYSTPLALAIGEPAYASWGLFAGLALYGVALSHVLRRVMFPYIDLKEFAHISRLHPVGASVVFLGVCLVLAAFISLMGNVVHAAELPANAKLYVPMLQDEQRSWWPNMAMPSALAAQVEQETCVSLKSARCWSPRSELRTNRERGVGLGQITKTSRFDALSEVKAANPDALAGWGWGSATLYDPRYQLRALVLKDKQGWNAMCFAASDYERLAFSFAAYNGGIGGVISDCRICKGTRGCDAGRWFSHVEHTSLKTRTVASGYGKSFFEINREYVRNVLIVRRARYTQVMGEA
ncbi:MAG: hypothetical protein WC208_09625 [Gallionella sp.]|jgi:hypothetical protein